MIIRKHLFILLALFCILGIAVFRPASAFSTKSGQIYDGNGNLVAIDGVAWIGFQDSNFLGGLWSTPFNPFGTQNGIIQLLMAPWTVPGSNITSSTTGVSFKSIRLPIQPGIWHDVTTVQSSPFDYQVTSSATPTTGNGPFCNWSAGADGSGHCTQSLGAAALLTATINQFNEQNIYVMLDFHHRPGLGDNFRDGTVVASDYTLQTYYQDVGSFVKTAPANVIGVDIFNEPHNLYWFQSNTSTTPAQPAWINVIAAAASAAYANNQNVLLFVEGPGGTTPGNDPLDPVFSQTTAICLAANTKVDNTANIGLGNSNLCTNTAFPLRADYIGSNWGENFRELLDTTQSVNGVAKFNATYFRSQLIAAIQANAFDSNSPTAIANWLLGPNSDGNGGHLVFAPHLYGSEVSGWQTDANDSKIRFEWNFSFLFDSGFPFVVGELGYDVELPATGGEDFFIDSVAPWLISKGINHNLFFWTWNQDDTPVGIRSNDSGYTLFAWKEQDLYNFYNHNTTVGTLAVSASSSSAAQCSAASDTLYLDGSSSGTAFTVSTGSSQSVATGTHTLSLASSAGSIPAGGSNTGTCTSTLSSTSVTVATGQTTAVTATYLYHAPAPTGTISVSASSTSDANCSNASDTLYLDSSTTGTAFQVSKGVSQTATTGTHTLKLASLTSIPAGGGLSGTCSSTLSASQVTVTQGQTTPVTATYKYQGTAGMSCTVTSATVTAQSDWGLPSLVDTFQIAVTLQGFPVNSSGGVSLSGSFVMLNPFIQNFWGNFGMQTSSISGATGQFTGTVYGTTFTLGGFISNATPISIGGNPLKSIVLNGVTCGGA